MAKQQGVVHKYLTPEWLDKIKRWSGSGATLELIATKLGVSVMSLHRWKKQYPEFKEALDAGKTAKDEIAKGSLMELIQGHWEEETTIERYKLDGKYITDDPKFPQKEVTKRKYVPPNPAAVFFYLKTQCGWRERSDLEIAMRPVNPLENMSKDELLKIAYSSDREEVIEVETEHVESN